MTHDPVKAEAARRALMVTVADMVLAVPATERAVLFAYLAWASILDDPFAPETDRMRANGLARRLAIRQANRHELDGEPVPEWLRQMLEHMTPAAGSA